jgi:hypothetical protein
VGNPGTAHADAYAELTEKLLAALETVHTPTSVQAFASQAARQIRDISANIPEFYAGEFLNIFKDAVVAQTRIDVADCERMITDAKMEAQVGTVELQARIEAARAAADQQAEHAVWQEREIREATCQAKVDEASKRADYLSLHLEVCNELASALGLSFN